MSKLGEKLLAVFGGSGKLTGCFIAGGAITSLHTNQPINDYDLYPKTTAARDEAIRWLFDSGYWCACATSRALTFVQGEKQQIQIMLFDTFETAEKIFECFDFTINMGAFDLDTEKFELHSAFLLHCSQRYLSFNHKTLYPYASAWRVRKYEERGYTIGKAEFFKITMACAEKPIKSWDDLKEQLGGVYGETLVIPDDEEFSIEAAYKAVSNTVPGSPAGYANAEEAIMMISDEVFPCIPRPNTSTHFVYVAGDWVECVTLPKNNRLADISELYPDLTFYKKVRRTDKEGVFQSLYKSTFEYRMNEEASSEYPHIYCYSSKDSARAHYSHGRGISLLTLKANAEDIILDTNTSMPRLKRCVVIDAEDFS